MAKTIQTGTAIHVKTTAGRIRLSNRVSDTRNTYLRDSLLLPIYKVGLYYLLK